MRPPITFVYANCVHGACGAWAFFELRTQSYGALGVARKREQFARLMAGLEAVEADIQILRVSRRWDPCEHARGLRGGYVGPHDQALDDYVSAQAAGLDGIGASVPRVYLGVHLAAPERDVGSYVAGVLERGPADLLATLRETLRWHDPHRLSARALEQLRIAADQAHARLADYLDVVPCNSTQLQWLIRRGFCRGLGEPLVDGLDEPQALVFECNGEALLAPLEGDVLRWMDGYVEHRGRALRIVGERGTSWQALLAAGALPERAQFPGRRLELMFAPPEGLPFPIDLALNARFLPNELATRLVRRRIQDADQIVRAESEGDQGVSDRGYDRTQRARDLRGYLQSASRPPLLRATLAVAVAAPTEQLLEERVEACRRAFGEVQLHRPVGEQLELFCQHLPAQHARVRGYDAVLTPEQVAAMMPQATHAVGSRAGFYLGHTLSGSRQPVLFNLREGSDLDRNTAILSVGALGSGKTTLDQKLKYEGFLLGARIVDCDPKGDHRLHLLDEVAPFVETIPLRAERGLRGLLDPLRVAPEHLRQDAAVSFLTDLLPVRCEASWETAVVRAVDAVVRRERQPTCSMVVRALGAGDAVDAQVAKALEIYSRSGLTQLGFADPSVRLPDVGQRQFTYISIRDLPAPDPGVARGDYSMAEKIGQQLVRLIAMFAMQLMSRERARLKLFSFDEGWRLLGDPVGRLLLGSLQRMGRSELAVPIISTQLVGDALADTPESLANLIGATFAFGMRSEAEAGRALAVLGLDPDDRVLRQRLLDFDAGRCLMRDHAGRVEAVQVQIVARRLLRELSTTPQAGPDAVA